MIATGTGTDEIVITTGTEVGALLVDGLGDGVLIECPTAELGFLRNMSFGLLQARLSDRLLLTESADARFCWVSRKARTRPKILIPNQAGSQDVVELDAWTPP